MEKNSKKREALKKRTKTAALGAAVVATLGTTTVSTTTAFAEAKEDTSNITQIENPYRLLINTLSSEEFKQACNERDSKKVTDILEQSGMISATTVSSDGTVQPRMLAIPVVAFENFAVVSFVVAAVAAAVVRDAPEVSVLDDLKVQDPGLRFILNDIYKETGDSAFVRECYDVISLPQAV